MFNGASRFTGDLSKWNMSSVTDTSLMFRHAEDFQSDISGWDVSKVTRMDGKWRLLFFFFGINGKRMPSTRPY